MCLSTPFLRNNLVRQPLLWTLGLLLSVAYGQQASPRDTPLSFTVEHFTRAQGLASGKVICVAQDSAGYLWIGTQEGLHRYDGYQLQLYQHNPADSTSLSNNTVEMLYVDREGTLWVGTWNGLNRYDPHQDAFRVYTYQPEDSTSLSGLMVIDLQADSLGRLWIAMGGEGKGGVCRYDPETDAFVQYLPRLEDPYRLSHSNVSVLYLDRAGTLWVGAGSPWAPSAHAGGLSRYDPVRDGFVRYEHDPADAYSLGAEEISGLYEDQAGTFWVATWGDGLQFMDRATGRFYPAETHPSGQSWLTSRTRSGVHGGIRFMHEDARGRRWIGGFLGGLDCYDPQTEALTHFTVGPAYEQGLTDLAVWRVAEDREQNLWVSTWKGLNKITANPALWAVIGKGGAGLKLRDTHVEELYQDAFGTLWAGTWAGLEKLDRSQAESQLYEIGATTPARNGRSEMVLGLIPAPRAKLWVGSLSHGLAQFDPQRQRFEDHSYPDQGFAINTLLDDGAGTLWAGSTKGIFYWHTSSDPLQTPPLSLPESAGWDVHDLQLSQGTQAWVASQTGLFRLDVQTGALEPILEGVNARVVLETDSALWVGTSGQGLLKVDPTDGRFQDFTLEAGLPGNTIQGLIRDRQGRLWITTTQGLAWLDLRTERIRSFSPAEAPPIYEFYPKSALAQPDGTLLLGGNGGILHLDPSQIMDAPHPPRPVISRLQVFDQAYPALPGAVDGAFRLRDSTQTFPHDQNDLTFEYAGLHFLRPEENTYRYQLVPYETDWREVGNRRTAIYPNLPPGTYTFRVQAANPDGRWSLATASLRVVIRLPWWKTPAAWVAYGLLVLGTFFAANRLQRHRLIRAERARAHLRETQLRAEVAEAHSLQLQELDEAKARLYANITHEFRTPLTVIMGMTDRIRGHVQERNLIHRNSQNLLRLMNQLLDLSKLEAGILTLNLVQGNIIQYLQYLTESFYSLAQQQGIRLLFYPELEELMMDFDEEKIQHVIYNLLSNALKFTPEQGKVVLHATRLDTGEESWLQLKVQDSGIGIAADDLPRIFERFYQADASSTRKEEGAGIGLSLTQDLVNMMAGEISVVSTLGKGTTFTLRLPIQRHAPLLVAGTPTMAQPLPTSAGASADAPAPPLPTPGDSTEKPILVLIEDNADVATYILELQGKTGQKERCHAALGRGCG